MMRRLSRLSELSRGAVTDPQVRHYLAARWRGRQLASRWQRQLQSWRQDEPQRAIIGIGLVEHMGDIIAAEPIVRSLREQHPSARLVWIVSERFKSLVQHHPQIDSLWGVGCLTEWSVAADALAFDHLYDLHVPGRDCAKCRYTHRRAEVGGPIDLTNYYSHGCLLTVFCKVAGLPIIEQTPELHLPESVVHAVQQLDLPERYVAIHCQSNQTLRDWCDAGWHHLVEQLIEQDVAVVEVGLKPVVQCDDPHYHNLCGQLSLLETAQVIGQAAVFVGIDSGPAHMANAMGTPGVILLGKYHQYDRYMPYSGRFASPEHATIVRTPEALCELDVQPVFDAVASRLELPRPSLAGVHA